MQVEHILVERGQIFAMTLKIGIISAVALTPAGGACWQATLTADMTRLDVAKAFAGSRGRTCRRILGGEKPKVARPLALSVKYLAKRILLKMVARLYLSETHPAQRGQTWMQRVILVKIRPALRRHFCTQYARKGWPVDVRIMDGKPGSKSGDIDGSRMVTTLPGQAPDGVTLDWSQFRNDESAQQLRGEAIVRWSVITAFTSQLESGRRCKVLFFRTFRAANHK